jgi:inner membrane protein involved in colicin E2 resistance
MVKRIAAIAFIYLCTAVAWGILGGTVQVRTHSQDSKLKGQVGQLWGTAQTQAAPSVHYETVHSHRVETTQGAKTVVETRTERTQHPVPLAASDVRADLRLEHRRKGLLWYPTYQVAFAGKYRVVNNTGEDRELVFSFSLPVQNAVYDGFEFKVGGKRIEDVAVGGGQFSRGVRLGAGQGTEVEVAYKSQGMEKWWYSFGSGVYQVKDFRLLMTTDFEEIDFPENSISPGRKSRAGPGWELEWKYSNLLSGVEIGMVMPQKLNPGPWVSQVTFSAPISLFLFFFLLFVLTTVKEVRIHPMNYFFVGAAFFSFHLLLAYLVDHVSIHAAFVLSSAVSVFLVVSYMRLVAGSRFAFMEVASAQLVYLVLFSYTFFFEGYTGLAITLLGVATLYLVMQYTGRVDWDKVFQDGRPSTS